MDGFDFLLEAELARVLDPIVRTPAPPRARDWRNGRRGRLRAVDGRLAIDNREAVQAPEMVVIVPAVVSIPSAAP